MLATLGILLIDKVDALAALGRQAEAKATLEKSIDELKSTDRAHQDNFDLRLEPECSPQRKDEMLRKAGDKTGADAADREATRLNEQYRKTTESIDQKAEEQYGSAYHSCDQGATLFHGGDYTAALGEFKAAESAIREYICLRPTDVRGYDELRNIYRWIQLTQKNLVMPRKELRRAERRCTRPRSLPCSHLRITK